MDENVIKTKGAIHYLTNDEIQKNIKYLNPNHGDKQIVTFILGGPQTNIIVFLKNRCKPCLQK